MFSVTSSTEDSDGRIVVLSYKVVAPVALQSLCGHRKGQGTEPGYEMGTQHPILCFLKLAPCGTKRLVS